MIFDDSDDESRTHLTSTTNTVYTTPRRKVKSPYTTGDPGSKSRMDPGSAFQTMDLGSSSGMIDPGSPTNNNNNNNSNNNLYSVPSLLPSDFVMSIPSILGNHGYNVGQVRNNNWLVF